MGFEMPTADQIRRRRKAARKRRPRELGLWEGELGGDALKLWREDRTYGRVPPPPLASAPATRRTKRR